MNTSEGGVEGVSPYYIPTSSYIPTSKLPKLEEENAPKLRVAPGPLTHNIHFEITLAQDGSHGYKMIDMSIEEKQISKVNT